ncbi:MAG: HDOD domain-containing protein [Pseudodesulfovibrio sp.]
MLSSAAPVLPDGEEAGTLPDLVRFYRDFITRMPTPFGDKKLLVSLPGSIRLQGANLPAGWEQCAFSLRPDIVDHSECLGFTGAVRAKGGIVVVDESLSASSIDLMGLGNIIRVSLAGKTPPEIINIRKKFKELDCEFLAVDVNSWEAFEGTRALGFSYFQGPFFAIPQMRDDMSLPASSVAKLQLLRELGNPDCEMEELAAIIASDVSLSYRILKYMNSAAMGMRNKIKSIQQAVSLLGLNDVRHWAMVVAMTDMDSSPKGEELAYISLQRGRFLSKLAESMKTIGHSSNTMFMLGLFSKLDAMLSCPMTKAMEDIPLDDALRDALCGTLNEFRDWLLLLDAVEIGNWTIANDILGRYGACLTSAATQYMKAASWAARLLPEIKH